MDFDIRKKAARFICKALDLSWPSGVVDFENQSLIVKGVKPIVDVQDEIETAFVWCWSIKDHLIEMLISKNHGLKRKAIENEIDSHECLVICADVANGLKHKVLKNSRSNKFARLLIMQEIVISTCTVSEIHRLDGKYFITPQNDECVKIRANVVSPDGGVLYDAYACLSDSLLAWDMILEKFSPINGMQ